ncbi:MAG: aromatic ring-hydroxylating dioxygenase subunit alpha [Steroidobacteraceae bacterium]
MTTAMNVLLRLQRRTPSTGLGREFYMDDAIFELDLELIFCREWLFAAHTCELPKTGSYLTLQIGVYPVLLVRGADGLIRAFVNSCRHRGARVCPEARGAAVKLVCPYHQWTYELDGRLFAARQMGPGFDRAQFGLKRLHCETVGGYIFVCLGAEAPDFAPTRKQLEPYLAPHRLADARVAFESTIIEEGNWKLVWENNRECYHCAVNHPELARVYSDTPTITSVSGAADDPKIVEHWQRCEAAGLSGRFHLSADGQLRAARMPLLGAAISYTSSGDAAVKRPLNDSIPREANIGALLMFHYPTTWNHLLGDHAITFRVLPLGPTRTQLTTKWLVHRDAVEGVDYDVEDLTRVWLATNEQDRRIVHENQIGMNSPTYEPGPFSHTHENGVSQFVDWYCSRLQLRLGTRELTDVA